MVYLFQNQWWWGAVELHTCPFCGERSYGICTCDLETVAEATGP